MEKLFSQFSRNIEIKNQNYLVKTSGGASVSNCYDGLVDLVGRYDTTVDRLDHPQTSSLNYKQLDVLSFFTFPISYSKFDHKLMLD